MCGIAGMAGPGAARSTSLVRRMTASLVHRGPDEDGFHVGDGVALGVRRLRVIDPHGSHQPVRNEDGSVWAVLNGELYNFKRARADLEARGHRFATRGDAEVIVHAWEEWGERCVEHLAGMFAFAVWDEGRRTLFLARDRIGIKPLYYALVGDALLFGSEMKALLAARPDFDFGPLDRSALLAFLSFGYVPSPRTMFTRARCLPPGHRLVLRAGAPPDIRPYWALPFVPGEHLLHDEAEALPQFLGALETAVVDQMVSDVPIGAFLSGGIDSTAVVWKMTEAAGQAVRTFAVGFGEASYDETPWARRVAARLGSHHHEQIIAPAQVAAELPAIVRAFDEPFADSSAIPLHFLSRLTRAHGVTVVLTGDGGDELFGGYETYLASRLVGSFRRLPSVLRTLARGVGARLPVSHRKVSTEQKLKRFLAFSESPPLVAHALWRSVFRAGELPHLLVDGLGNGLTDRGAAELLVGDLDALPAPDQGINSFCYVDTKFYLPADMLVKVDRVTMAHSLEARVPLLDERLVELAFRLGPRLKWRGRTGKVLLRRSLRGVVDERIVRRPKAGFNVPMPVWIGGPLRDLFRDTLSPAAVARGGIVRPGCVERLFAEHEHRQADHSSRLYALLALHLWLDAWAGPLRTRPIEMLNYRRPRLDGAGA